MPKPKWECLECHLVYDSEEEAKACEARDKALVQQVPIGTIIKRGPSYEVLASKLLAGKRVYQVSYPNDKPRWYRERTVLLDIWRSAHAIHYEGTITVADMISGDITLKVELNLVPPDKLFDQTEGLTYLVDLDLSLSQSGKRLNDLSFYHLPRNWNAIITQQSIKKLLSELSEEAQGFFSEHLEKMVFSWNAEEVRLGRKPFLKQPKGK